MVNPSSQTNAATPEQELAALVSQVAALSKIALDMTRHCLDINEKLPRVVRAQVDAAIAEHTPATAFYEETAPTPDQLEAQFPPGRGDSQAWYVVCTGRQPGLYASADEADEQVSGVPHQHRRKLTGRGPALAYYRQLYELGQVMRLTEIPGPGRAHH
ncbi:hypothetical protein B0H10DRAFT_2101155 [Mycena sp. CBHHK59/15]|nr:hypothetical protein B0H10DRAFT_2129435 [Mycena sp. CBHHK59/15]KAJ6556671.1 hypothetical protein B0H10DRAFT_2241203 [Mycena sp. CBHHK59/15]KAJ6578920.1 hypothetical protein B0H10DRAFT_2101155 [Mycena sp. CBHHK59/15]